MLYHARAMTQSRTWDPWTGASFLLCVSLMLVLFAQAAAADTPMRRKIIEEGRQVFQENCVACHGADGKGNTQIGAPNLTDATWLYGGTEAAITESVTKGRGEATAVTRMPAHKDRLDAGKLDLLVAYVWGLSNAR